MVKIETDFGFYKILIAVFRLGKFIRNYINLKSEINQSCIMLVFLKWFSLNLRNFQLKKNMFHKKESRNRNFGQHFFYTF
jgi:hypothetical protein